MAEVIETLINDIVATIVREASPERIVLFGSVASGSSTQESDVDLLVVESEEFGIRKSRRKELARLSKAICGFHISIDLLLYSKKEVERWKGSLNNVVARAFREGKIVYERH